MNSLIGAQRPAFKRKILWIAVAAIVLVLAWAKAGFPCPPCPWYTMGPDGVLHVDGMMPPDGGGMRQRPNSDIVVVQQDGGQSYTYAASNNHGVYLVKRNGKPWVTLTLNKTSGLYELTDPNGTHSAVFKLGTPKNGPIKANSAPVSTH